MPGDFNFVDDSSLTNSPITHAEGGKEKKKLIKMTPKSQSAFKKAVKKRLAEKIQRFETERKDFVETYKNELVDDYKKSYSTLKKGFEEASVQKRSDIDHLSEQIDYLAKLNVKIVNADRKLQTLNDRLVIKGKKTFNLKDLTFKKIVSTISKFKNSIIDKKVITNKYEDSKDEIDRLMSEGRYYSAGKELEKIRDYEFVASTINNIPEAEVYSDSNSMIFSENNNNPTTVETSLDADVNVVESERVDTVSSDDNDLVDSEQVEIAADTVNVKSDSGVQSIPGNFENVNDNSIVGEQVPPVISDVLAGDNTEVVERPSVVNYGIDFTKLIKKPTVTKDETVPIIGVDESDTDIKESADAIIADLTDAAETVGDTGVDFNNLANELGIKLDDSTVTEEHSEVVGVEDTKEDSSEIVTPSVDINEDIKAKADAIIANLTEAEETFVNTGAAIDNLANELGVKLDTPTLFGTEEHSEVLGAEDTKEDSSEIVTPPGEIEGQVDFDSVVLSSGTGDVVDDTLTSVESDTSLEQAFTNVDNLSDDNSKTDSILDEISRNAQSAIAEIDSQVENFKNSEIVSEVPIVNPSPAVESVVEQKDEEVIIDGEKVELNHELLKKLYDIIRAQDLEIEQLRRAGMTEMPVTYENDQTDIGTNKRKF